VLDERVEGDIGVVRIPSVGITNILRVDVPLGKSFERRT